MIKVAINGFGRIGRILARIILQNKHFELIAINDIYDIYMMDYLLKHDSIYGNFKKRNTIKMTSCADIKKLDWSGVDILFECSGIYTKEDELKYHLENGAKKIILSTYSNELPMFIMGFNEKKYNNENIISSCSCTANCVVPILSVIDKYVGIQKCNITTIHSYTSEQNLLDNKNTDIRRSRSATQNIIPLSSNVANASVYFLPHLKDKLSANSIRIPVGNGVLIDLHIKISQKSKLSHIKKILNENINKNIVKISKNFMVSTDVKGIGYSSIIDENSIHLVQDDFLQLLLWQDNEYGYAKKVEQMAELMKEYL